MIKIKKKLKYSNNRQIFRLLISETDKLLVEERDRNIKQAFFNCIDLDRDKKIFEGLQMQEKYWTGIETFYNDLIVFHGFVKPDMPMHKGMIVYDVASGSILWQNEDYNFLFIHDEQLYAYRQKFEGVDYYRLDLLSGEVIDNIDDPAVIDDLGLLVNEEFRSRGYLFPEVFRKETGVPGGQAEVILNSYTGQAASTEYIIFEDTLFFNYFSRNADGKYSNTFFVIDIQQGKIIFNEVLETGANAPVPDLFFIKNNYLFLLKGKTELLIFDIKK